MQLNEMTACDLKPLLASGTISSRDVMLSVLDRIASVEADIGAFLLVRDAADLLREAELIDTRRKKGDDIGTLAGLPVAIKDNICTQGLPTTCASRMLQDYMPPWNAHVVDRILAEDGIILGKTNMDEFSMGSSTENSAFKTTRNPWNLDYVPGGTSGGSAAAIAANETIFAIGSDTGGSIRQPASYCGAIGMKPTYGLVSRRGLVAYGSSLDQIGVLTKSPCDARILLSAISGHDPLDATSSRLSFGNKAQLPCSLRIGIPKEYFVSGLDKDVSVCAEKLIGKLHELGHTTVEISLPHTKYAVPAYYIISSAEMSANLERYDGCRYGFRAVEYSNLRDMIVKSRTQGLGPEVRRRIFLGTYVLSSGHYQGFYEKAQKVRTLISQDFASAFAHCDVIMNPVTPGSAFRIGEKIADPLDMYLVDIFSVTANLSGLPAISVPFGSSNIGLPLSMQFTAPMFADDLLLQLAEVAWENPAEVPIE